ncbi:hypothetical protein [Scytonema sp. NUACC26]|uniref:hypothetical protein n=1 Tax=Scytonema sp. NUACC26 TaxID=3140176 RepID=UPI0034DBADE8
MNKLHNIGKIISEVTNYVLTNSYYFTGNLKWEYQEYVDYHTNEIDYIDLHLKWKVDSTEQIFMRRLDYSYLNDESYISYLIKVTINGYNESVVR